MKTFNKYLEYFLVFLMALMLLSVCWQVITRYFLGNPSSFTDELARYLMIWVGLLGGAWASGKGMHLAIDLLPSKLEGKAKYRLQVLLHLLVIFFVVTTLIVGGSRLVYITYTLEQTSAAMQLPLAYVYIILPISGVLITLFKIRDIIALEAEPQD